MEIHRYEQRRRRVVFALIAITFLTRASLGLRDDINLATRLHEDDSFYLHNTSYYLAEGKGLTADGVHPTNGIQPLIVVLNAPFYIISEGDKWMALHLSFILAAIIDCISVWLIYKLLTVISPQNYDKPIIFTPAIIGCALWTFLYPIILQTMNGMETGLYSMLILASVYIYTKHSLTMKGGKTVPAFQKIGLGIILGLMVLARIDGVFLVIAFLCFDYFYYKQRKIVQLFIAPFTAFIVSSPWWIYNYVYFGNIIPISGQAESIGGPSIAENIVKLSVSLADILSVFLYLPFYGSSPTLIWIWIIATFGIGIFIAKKLSLFEEMKKRYDLKPLLPLCYTGIFFGLFYTLSFHAPYFIPRYLQPLRIFWLLLAALFLPIIVSKIRSSNGSRHLLLSTAGIVFLSAAAIFTIIGYSHNFTGTGTGVFYTAGLWARQHPQEKIGMQQAGIASFISDNIVNLDGKVNAEVMEAMKHHERGKYILNNHISYLMDWEEFAKVLAKEAESEGGKYELIDSSGLLRMYKKIQ